MLLCQQRYSFAHLAVQTLREELNHSLCVVAEQLEKEGAEVDWISVLNLCEKPYNANGPKQYGIVPFRFGLYSIAMLAQSL